MQAPLGTSIQKNINKKTVQRHAARLVKLDNNRESSVTLMMQDLQWDSLERRREVKRLTLFYEAIHQETSIPFPNHLFRSGNKTRGRSKRFIQVQVELRYMQTIYLIEQ